MSFNDEVDKVQKKSAGRAKKMGLSKSDWPMVTSKYGSGKPNGQPKKKSKEQNEKDYNNRDRSWDSKNRYHGSGVGGNTI